MLARKIIQHASNTIIEILANPTIQELDKISQVEFAESLEKMLTNYMTPSVLADSNETIRLFAQNMAECHVMSTPK